VVSKTRPSRGLAAFAAMAQQTHLRCRLPRLPHYALVFKKHRKKKTDGNGGGIGEKAISRASDGSTERTTENIGRFILPDNSGIAQHALRAAPPRARIWRTRHMPCRGAACRCRIFCCRSMPRRTRISGNLLYLVLLPALFLPAPLAAALPLLRLALWHCLSRM